MMHQFRKRAKNKEINFSQKKYRMYAWSIKVFILFLYVYIESWNFYHHSITKKIFSTLFISYFLIVEIVGNEAIKFFLWFIANASTIYDGISSIKTRYGLYLPCKYLFIMGSGYWWYNYCNKCLSFYSLTRLLIFLIFPFRFFPILF